MDFLKVESVTKKEGDDFSLKGISLLQRQFQKIAIAGAAGSGKSTLLRIIAGIISPDTGQVVFEGERVKKIPEEKLIPGHPGIAYLSQHFELRNHYRMEELLSYANVLPEGAAEKVYAICKVDHLLKRKATQLSGGEKQRMALARLLVGAPRLLILDEPFSNLDMIHKNLLKKVIADIGDQLGISCIMVSHDPLDTLSWADEIMVMKDGNIEQQGSPKEIYLQPVNEYVAGLFGKYNLISPEVIHNLIPGYYTSLKEDLFIRPEDIILANRKSKQSVSGIAKKVVFFGGHYEIDIDIDQTTLVAKTLSSEISPGDNIHVVLKHDHLR